MKILGISRSPRFSPNSEDRDAAIFNAVRTALTDAGHELCCCSEDDRESLVRMAQGVDLIFTMARDGAVISFLAEKERAGVRVVNSPRALMTYTRGAMFRMFHQAGLPVPATHCVHGGLTEADALPAGMTYPLWVKRSDECAQVKDDVRLVHTPEEAAAVCRDYFSRGVKEALLCEHIEGELLKFYGVLGTGFFYVVSTDTIHGFSKFGLEHTNKTTSHHAFDTEALKAHAERAAVLSGISVYGGDAVVREDGIYIIDFNDWPSFSACRAQAAGAIATCILSTTK